MLMFIFPFVLVKHFLMFQVQYLFVIKLDNNLPLGNIFIDYTIDIYFLHYITRFIFHIHFFHEDMKVK